MSAYTPVQKLGTSSSLTIVTTAYTAGDQAGAVITLSAIGAASGLVLINDISMVDNSARIGAHEIRLYSAAGTAPGDNAAWTGLSDADADVRQGPVLYASSIIVDTNSAQVDYAFKPFLAKCDGSGNLYLYVILRAVPTSNFFSAVGDLNFTVGGFQVS